MSENTRLTPPIERLSEKLSPWTSTLSIPPLPLTSLEGLPDRVPRSIPRSQFSSQVLDARGHIQGKGNQSWVSGLRKTQRGSLLFLKCGIWRHPSLKWLGWGWSWGRERVEGRGIRRVVCRSSGDLLSCQWLTNSNERNQKREYIPIISIHVVSDNLNQFWCQRKEIRLIECWHGSLQGCQSGVVIYCNLRNVGRWHVFFQIWLIWWFESAPGIRTPFSHSILLR